MLAEVTAKHVFKRFGEVTAVNDFDLKIRDKEFLVLVGPSGCGKTTTLRMVAGLEEISDGEIFIGDRLVNDVAPKDRDIAMVFQNYALYPHMNVYDNMAFGLKLRHFKREDIDRRVKEAADILGIGQLLKRKPKELSGGQRQRVALGRAIVREPQAFLMDEPLSNLDAKLRVQTRTELKKLHARLETTAIYVTHDQTEAMTMGDRIVVMKDGVIQQVAEPQEIYNQPANIFVAGFIGAPAMNFLKGRVVKEGDNLFMDLTTSKMLVPAERGKPWIPYAGREVVFGVRPEDLVHDGAFREAHPDWVVPAKIEVTEPMGSETYLYLSVGNQAATARAEGNVVAHDGQTMDFAINMERVHAFDPETERAIA